MNAKTLADLRGVTALLFGPMLAGCARGAELESDGSGGSDQERALPAQTSGSSSAHDPGVTHAGSTAAEGGAVGAGGEGGTLSSSGSTSASSTSSSSGATSSTGGGACDGTSSCTTCSSCGTQGDCAAAYAACLADSQCTFYATCSSGCLTDICIQGCQALYPAGAGVHQSLADCVCAVCPVDCSGSVWGC